MKINLNNTFYFERVSFIEAVNQSIVVTATNVSLNLIITVNGLIIVLVEGITSKFLHNVFYNIFVDYNAYIM